MIKKALLSHPNSLSLDFSGNKLTEIPGEIGQFSKLTSLDLRGNLLTELPPEIGQLTNLQNLYLSANHLIKLPPEIGQLTNLMSLDITGNQLTKLPVEIGQFVNLHDLHLAGNQLTELPSEIGQNIDLTRLDLSGNKLTKLPKEIGKLIKLSNLYLYGNKLTKLPKEIGKLINLTNLYLHENELVELPEEIGELVNLIVFSICKNKLTVLPPKIGNLTNLTILNLASNRLVELPSIIGKLVNLSSLDIRENELTELPKEIGQLTNLSSLDIMENELTELPKEIGQLANLSSLCMYANKLTELPEEIGQLANLSSLDLTGNKLIKLTAGIGKLSKLKNLFLRGNNLAELPLEIGQLVNLTCINLIGNSLSQLPPEIGQLTNLNTLEVIANQLTKLPPEIGKLDRLTSLVLSNNQLTEIPSEIGNLTNLISLVLSENRLAELPPEIGNLTNLTNFDIRNNPLSSLPPEIQGKGKNALLSFYRQQLEQNTDYLYEAKLLIVGEGGAGKTTLSKKIQNSSYQLHIEEESTVGINIIRFSFLLENGAKFWINIWDFGGQEIYHETHQFFLTERSLYSLVADARRGDSNFHWWLNIVELLSGNSPILIVKNERQDVQVEINERQLKSEFSNLSEILPTNLATNRGLERLIDSIKYRIRHLPHVGTALPKNWISVRQTLEQDSRDYIDLDEYLDICDRHGFTRHEYKLQLSGYLHDLGVYLHFQKDDLLKKIIILKPTWSTSAVYKVLHDDRIKTNFGKFSREDLNRIWNEDKYINMQGELLRLMIKFKLCYEIPGYQNTYIAPQLLPVNQLEYEWDEDENLLLCYEYEFMPKGIITSFIVEMNLHIEEQNNVWKSGVILSKDETRAEIIEFYEKKKINIRISGYNKT
jgi:internalin A